MKGSIARDRPIRIATLHDAAELARLIAPLGHPITAESIAATWPAWEREGNTALVVEGDGRLLGVITLSTRHVLHRDKPLGRLTSLAVDPEAQGQGIGRSLVQAAEDLLRARGCGLVEVTSHARRVEAHEFYEHLGYERTSHRFQRVLG